MFAILCCLAVLESLASFTVSKHSKKEFGSIPSEQMQHLQTETAMPKVTVMSFNVSRAQAVSRHEVMVYLPSMKHTLQSRYMHRQAAEDDDLLMSLGSVDQNLKMLLRWWDSGAALDQICDVLCVTRPDLVGLQDTSGMFG